MATKKYLDYEGLAHFLEKLNQKYAPISAIVFKGSVDTVADLPTVATEKAGFMYNIKAAGETTTDFVEGAGHEISEGENVAAVELYTGEYTLVATVNPTDDPKALGWYEEDVVSYVNITSELDPSTDDPHALGLYEQDGGSATGYVLTNDTSVQPGKDYFDRVATYKLSQDRLPVDGKDYFTADTEMKWDLMGGIFDLEGKYLEFGSEFPQGPADRMVDGRTFLYMGADKKVYTYVTSPSGRPSENGYFEGTFVKVADSSTIVNPKEEPVYEIIANTDRYFAVTPSGAENPSEMGWYESDGGTGYVLSTDTTVDAGKTYYERKDAYVRSDDTVPAVGKDYYTGTFAASTDVTVDADKYYYTEAALYTKSIIYAYDATNHEWVAQSSGGSGDMIPITNAEIDDLFI